MSAFADDITVLSSEQKDVTALETSIRQYEKVCSANWEDVLEKVVAQLSKWKWLLLQLSYRGRVLMTNNLEASTLWHKVIVLEPPGELICNIQRTGFFRSGEHWTGLQYFTYQYTKEVKVW